MNSSEISISVLRIYVRTKEEATRAKGFCNELAVVVSKGIQKLSGNLIQLIAPPFTEYARSPT